MKILDVNPLAISVEPGLLGDHESRLDVFFYHPKYLSALNILKNAKWEKRRLMELCKEPIHRGKTPEYGEKDIPVIKTINLKNEEIILDPISYVSGEFYRRNKRSRALMHDILIASTGVGSIGKVDIVEDDQRFVVDGHISIIRIEKKLVRAHYILAFLRSKLGQLQIEQRIRGATGQIELYPRDIETIQIIIPPVKIQDIIVSLIRNAIMQKKSQLEEAKTLVNGISEFVLSELGLKQPEVEDRNACMHYFAKIDDELHARIEPFFYHPKYIETIKALKNGKYPLLALKDISRPITSGATPLAKGKDYTSKGKGVPFVRIVDTKDGEIRLDNVLYIKKSIHENMLKRSQLKSNDVLLSIAGTIGVATVVPSFIHEANINQALAKIRLRERIEIDKREVMLNAHYVSAFLNCGIGRKLTERFSRPVVQANINLQEVGSIKIPVPPTEIQNKIADEVKRRIQLAKKLRKRANQVLNNAMSEVEKLIVGTRSD